MNWPFRNRPPEQGTKPRLTYQMAYLNWMKRFNHPDLVKSNYQAHKFLDNLEHEKHKLTYLDRPP